MRPFLEQVADHYIKAGGISGRCFIFPNRRSQVFFKKYLGEAVKSLGSPIIAPKMLTINDFFYEIAGSKPTDRVSLLLELYDCYKALFPKAEPLDEFIFWGDVILGDFDDVDKYLADPSQLYTNIKEYKKIQDLVLCGDLYRIDSPFDSGFFTEAVVSKDKSKAELICYRRFVSVNNEIKRVKMAGLDPDASYRLEETGITAKGSTFMNVGFAPKYPHSDFAAVKYHVTKI